MPKQRECAFKILVPQLVKGMGRAVPVQDLPGPIIEQPLDPFDLAARQLIEPRPFGKELAQQPIGILVRVALPGTLRMGKVHLHLGLLRGEPVFAHLALGRR